MKIPFALIFAHARRTWLRSFLTVTSVFVAILIFGFLRTFIVGMETTLAETSPSRLVSGSALSLFAHLPKRLEPEIKAQPHVKAVTHWTWFGGIYIDDSPEHFWGRFGVDVESMREVYGPDLILEDAVWEEFAATRTGCIVGKELAAKEGFKLGSRIPLRGNFWPGTLELTVVGIYESRLRSFDEATLFMHWDYMNETSAKNGGRRDLVSLYSLLLDDPDHAAAVCTAIDTTYESSDNRTHTQTERLFQAQFNSMWGNLPLYFSILGTVVLVACLMVTANTMLLNARERVKEVGVLKTLGFSGPSIATTTLVEALFLCLLGGALALALVRSLDGKTLMFVIASVPASTVFEGLGIAAGLGLLSGLVPAWVAGRLDIVDAIRRRA